VRVFGIDLKRLVFAMNKRIIFLAVWLAFGGFAKTLALGQTQTSAQVQTSPPNPSGVPLTDIDIYIKIFGGAITGLATLIGLPMLFLSFRKALAELRKIALETEALEREKSSKLKDTTLATIGDPSSAKDSLSPEIDAFEEKRGLEKDSSSIEVAGLSTVETSWLALEADALKRRMPNLEWKRWTPIRILGRLSEVAVRFRRIVALISAAGAIGGFIIYYSPYVAHQIYILWAVTAFVLLIAVLVTFVVTSAIFRRRDKDVTAEFSRLENYYRPFESEAVRLFYEVALTSSGSVNFGNLEILLSDYLEAICNTAVGVFAAKKRNKKPFRSNIKRIELREQSSTPTYVYRPLVRSSNFGPFHAAYDDNLEANPLEVKSNYAYRRIFDPHLRNDFFVGNDIAELLGEIKRSRETTSEPNQHSMELYQSLMVFPILGLRDTNDCHIYAGIEQYLSYKNRIVFGVMTIESGQKNAFDQASDVAIMQELSSSAFSAFRLFQAIWDVSQRKGPRAAH
jgi:hypothetical protein